MDKQSAIKLIRETFENPFDKVKFVRFVKDLFNKIAEDTFEYQGQYIPDAFKPYIQRLERVGKYMDIEGKKIDILITHLKKETSLERARTMQRNFIAWYLEGSRGGTLKDAAVVAFVSPGLEDWRFSLVKMEYKLTQTKTGRPKGEEEFTPAKRFSFLVGRNEPNHTAQSRLYPRLKDDINNPTLTQLEDAFNIEIVTKEFFEKYRDLFIRIKEAIDDIVNKYPAVNEDFTNKGVDTVDFAKKLMGQIVFLYFLQKKGWFGVEKGRDWGTGSKRFLRDLFEGKIIQYKNFFNDILEPLFYDALARDRSDIDHYNEHFKTKIPFLNGGLFDPINNYNWVNTDILLSDELFSNNKKTKQGDIGDGILDIFDRYNFTVKEDEPLEKEVAIDPELLGKAYEKFNAIRSDNFEEYKKALRTGQKGAESKFNKEYGVYYTPREIVHYMCQQSLISYLVIGMEDRISKEAIEFLILNGEKYIEYLKTAKEKKDEGKKSERYRETDYFIELKKHATDIDNFLSNIKVCDPAIGSGAFPVGMMTEINKARLFFLETKCLSDSYKSLQGHEVKRNAYNYKRDCIQNSLYGVDIDPGAVEIAKLRLWLSLVVEEEDIKRIRPLPNLDYKIMQGNSLLEEYNGIKLFDERIIEPVFDESQQVEQLKKRQLELQSEYFNLHSSGKLTKEKKYELELELNKIARSLSKLDKKDKQKNAQAEFSDFLNKAKKKAEELKQLHKEFFDTFQKSKKDELKKIIEKCEWGLIEVSLAEQDKKEELQNLEQFKKTNTKPYFLWKLNFEEVFQEKGGFDVVIANPPYILLQNINVDESALNSLRNNYSSFQYKVDTYHLFIELGINLLNKRGVISYITPNTFIKNKFTNRLRKVIVENTLIEDVILFYVRVFEDSAVDNLVFICRKDGKDSSHKIRFHDIKSKDFINEVKNTKYFLQNEIKPNDYLFDFDLSEEARKILEKIESKTVKFGDIGMAYFGIQTYDRQKYVSNKKDNSNYLPVIDGGNINKYKLDMPKEFIDFRPENIKSGGNPDVYQKTRIVVRQIGECPEGTLCQSGIYTLNTIYNLYLICDNFDIRYILSIINSKLIKYFWEKRYYDKKATFPKIKKNPLLSIPIKKIFEEEQRPFIDYVNKIVAITKDDDYLQDETKQAKVKGYERQIDQMVYELYGLTDEETKIIEESAI